MGFFDFLNNGDAGGLLGAIGDKLASNSGLLLGIGANGFAGAIPGMRADQAAAEMRQKQQERELTRQGLKAFARAQGIPEELANSEDVVKLYVQQKNQERELGLREREFGANQDYRNRSLGLQEREFGFRKDNAADERDYRNRQAEESSRRYSLDYALRSDSQEEDRRRYEAQEKARQEELALKRSAPIDVDPNKSYIVRDPSSPDGYRPLNTGGAGAANPYALGGNGDQSKAANFATRAAVGSDLLNKFTSAGTSRALQGIAAVAPGEMVPASKQQFDQAEKAFINALLRRESGAAIQDSEYVKYRREFIPQPGDAPEVLAQKADARRNAVLGLMAEAPRGYRPPTGWESPAAAGRSSMPEAAARSPFSRADLEAEARRRGLIK